jgi:hypothetical protein
MEGYTDGRMNKGIDRQTRLTLEVMYRQMDQQTDKMWIEFGLDKIPKLPP